ncbi:Transcriptional activator protein ExaE [Lacunisphaera limnophila]|uniref:Transcriptional activator protein ExaE n=1 Tax=Lacunisphaera limnophila TaxID=1838286 RepID=A0A1D8ASZ9_9BACT|nr:response regulator transcription factor [Lacunisphaera limnophila]AOS44027.1 Transcriptional activator protein ExaE [Lacunisphaera limnophila]
MPPEKKSARIVLIEDHTMVRQLFAHLIREDLGHTLAADCTTVAEGTAALLKEKPDLAIVDWMLPDGRGFDLVRQVGPKLPRTRWLFMSSNEQGHLVREAVSLGVQGFVMKRSDLATMRDAVRRVLNGETYYCPASARLLVDRMVGEGHAMGVSLTPREREVLRGFAGGENPKVLADRLGVSAKTVQNHLSILRDKLGLQEPAALVHYAIRHGYIEAP